MIEEIRKLLKELEAREAAATPGPWVQIPVMEDTWAVAGYPNGNAPETYADADFIAHARADLPRLRRALLAALAGLEAAQDFHSDVCARALSVHNDCDCHKVDVRKALAEALSALKGEGK